MGIPLEGELKFSPEGNNTWKAIIGNAFILVDQSEGITKISYKTEKQFEDLYEALAYIIELTGQRPTFGMDENTANTKARN